MKKEYIFFFFNTVLIILIDFLAVIYVKGIHNFSFFTVLFILIDFLAVIYVKGIHNFYLNKFPSSTGSQYGRLYIHIKH